MPNFFDVKCWVKKNILDYLNQTTHSITRTTRLNFFGFGQYLSIATESGVPADRKEMISAVSNAFGQFRG
jgi:hypothetical protein